MRGVKNFRSPDWHLIYSAEWKEVDPWVKVIAQMRVTDRPGDIVKRSSPWPRLCCSPDAISKQGGIRMSEQECVRVKHTPLL